MPGHIDRYEVKQLLAEGAMGKVYLARDPKLERDVAIKVLNAQTDEEVRGRFRLEARAVAALDHPNIVGVHDYSGEQATHLYLVMEYVRGESLYVLSQKFGTMSEPTALCVGHELALALEHAHSHGVVHRDVKPENVLLANGRVVLTDFGGVKLVTQGHSARGQSNTAALGTPGFMAPEQFAGKGIGPATDVFGLGATLYNLTTGRIAYEGGSVDTTLRNLKAGKYVDARDHQQLLSPELSKLLAKCLAAKPGDRIPNAARLRAEIRKLLVMHGVEEVREELQRYSKSPAKYALAQRDRAVDVLFEKITAALRERDFDRAALLAERVQTLAPLDERVREVAGMGAEAGVIRSRVGRPARHAGFWRGLAVGIAVGALVTAALFLLS